MCLTTDGEEILLWWHLHGYVAHPRCELGKLRALPWEWRLYVARKRQVLLDPHGVISQKIISNSVASRSKWLPPCLMSGLAERRQLMCAIGCREYQFRSAEVQQWDELQPVAMCGTYSSTNFCRSGRTSAECVYPWWTAILRDRSVCNFILNRSQIMSTPSCDSSVAIATGWMVGVRFPTRVTFLFSIELRTRG
jgi:hypothetical protein